MKVLKEASHLKQLYEQLLRLPDGKNEVDILGTLHSAIRGLWKYEAVVDRWPHFSAIILRPLQLIPRQSKYQEVYVCGKTEVLQDLLLYKESLPWNECITFRACPVSLKPILAEAATQYKGTLLDVDSIYERRIYSPTKPTKLGPLPKGFVLKQMSLKDAPIVCQYWNKFAEENNHCLSSLETIQHLIENSVTSCLYDSDDQPVSWTILHHSGAGISAYTLPEHRGKNFIRHVGRFCGETARRFGQPHMHGINAVGNTKVLPVAAEFGKRLPEYVTFYHYIPVKSRI